MRVLLSSLFSFLLGCSAQKAYHGPDRTSDQLARFTGYSTVCEGRLILTEFDDEFKGMRLEAPPGKHKMIVNFWSEPFWPDFEPDLSPLAICLFASKHSAEFEAEAGLRYTFVINQDPKTGHHLTVWETNNSKDIDSHQISAKVEDIAQKRICTLSSYYDECFFGHR